MSKTSSPSISIIIVTFNSSEYLRETLDSAFNQTCDDYEVILVENNSTDDSLKIAQEYESKGLKVFSQKENLGFCGGNNYGVSKSKGDVIFLLNPDAFLEPDSVEKVKIIFSNENDQGIIGTKLLSLDGQKILHCGGEIGDQAHCKLYGRFEEDKGQWESPKEVEYIVGAVFILSKKLWDKLGGFDEDFFPAYYEDSDLCFRARKAGHTVRYWPINVKHHENVSLDYQSERFLRIHHRNRILFLLKNYSLFRLLSKTLPKEIAWLFSTNSKGVRRICVQNYFSLLRYRFTKRKLSTY